jgi:hypothetical protein
MAEERFAVRIQRSGNCSAFLFGGETTRRHQDNAGMQQIALNSRLKLSTVSSSIWRSTFSSATIFTRQSCREVDNAAPGARQPGMRS